MERQGNIIDRIADFKHARYPEAEIYLFGSQSRGDANTSSDWDLLVLLDKAQVSFEEETKLMDELYEIELETGEVISPLIYSKNEWENKHKITPLYSIIAKEGRRI